jgi:hypothetical protein
MRKPDYPIRVAITGDSSYAALCEHCGLFTVTTIRAGEVNTQLEDPTMILRALAEDLYIPDAIQHERVHTALRQAFVYGSTGRAAWLDDDNDQVADVRDDDEEQ